MCIAGYTLIDKAGLRHADPLPHLALALTLPALTCVALVARRKSWQVLRAAVTPASVVANIGVFAVYALTLAALARGAAAPVAAVREVSILLVTELSVVLLHESMNSRQWVGAVLIIAGVMTIALA